MLNLKFFYLCSFFLALFFISCEQEGEDDKSKISINFGTFSQEGNSEIVLDLSESSSSSSVPEEIFLFSDQVYVEDYSLNYANNIENGVEKPEEEQDFETVELSLKNTNLISLEPELVEIGEINESFSFKYISIKNSSVSADNFKSFLETENPKASLKLYQADGQTLATNLGQGFKLIVKAEDDVTQEVYYLVLKDIFGNYLPLYFGDKTGNSKGYLISGTSQIKEYIPSDLEGKWFSSFSDLEQETSLIFKDDKVWQEVKLSCIKYHNGFSYDLIILTKFDQFLKGDQFKTGYQLDAALALETKVVVLTPLMLEVAQSISLYGFNDWELLKSKTVASNQIYSDFRDKVYTIFKKETDKLFFGLSSQDLDGLSPEKRYQIWDQNLFFTRP